MTNPNIIFSFRSKFEKLITEDNRVVITAAFEKFFGLDSDLVRKCLWKLTYSEESASIVLNFLGLNVEVISGENISLLRNELRYQYEQQIVSDIWYVDIPYKCEDVFENLENHTDIIVAYIVYEHCKESLYVPDADMQRVLYLLKEDEENKFFGGIRSLHFNKKEAEYLKPFHMLIHDLLKSMYDNMQKDSKNMPFAGLDKRIEEAGISFTSNDEDVPAESAKVPEEDAKEEAKEMQQEKVECEEVAKTQVENHVLTSESYKPVNSENVLFHKDVFVNFVESDDLNILFRIHLIGFDLNEVVAKKEKISNFIKADKALREAIAALNE